MSILDIYKASAGAGKTFALTLQYFKIIFSTPLEYRNVLAVTFTNKATEEMKSRIIHEIHKIAIGDDTPYSEKLRDDLGLSREQLKNKAVVLRTLLLHDYGRISVTTIDQFFQRVIKSFIREMSISPGYCVELHSDVVLEKAIDQVMMRIKSDKELEEWVKELMLSNVDSGKSWNVKRRISELGEEIFKENYMLFDEHTLETFSDKKLLREYQVMLRQHIESFEKKLLALAEKACLLIKENGLTVSDFKSMKSGAAGYFYKLADKRFDAPSDTVRKAINDVGGWVTKNKEADVLGRINSIYPHLSSLLRECVEWHDTYSPHYNTAIRVADNLYQLGILNDLYTQVRAFCDEEGVMLLSDTTHLLNILIDGNDTPFLFEKMGNYYKHLMIDEFQDTSAMQWRNFKPLVVNSLAEGNKAMIVGDVKQSIYRWRNGDWSLLAMGIQQEFQHLGTNDVILQQNWRSTREVVDFNNRFFEKAAVCLRQQYDSEVGSDNTLSDQIAVAYDGLKQEAMRDKAGYVDIEFGAEKSEEEGQEQIVDSVISIVNDILARGGQLKDIVILVRGKDEGAFVANYLMAYNRTNETRIPFISNDSLYVWSSPYVKFVVAVLKYLTTPYDLVNKAAIGYYYTEFILNKTCGHETFSAVKSEDIFALVDAAFKINTENIRFYSLFETSEIIIDKFGLRNALEALPYLIAFQDIVFEYETVNTNSIPLFMEWWEKEKKRRVLSTSEEIDAIRIFTIHKSKGLEFEYVILPFCSWELDTSQPARCLWCRNKEEGFNRLDYVPLNYSKKLTETLFREDYNAEHLKAYIDNLNLLYVALTRAKSELYVRPYSPKTNKDGSMSSSNIGTFIYQVLFELKQDGTYSDVIDDSLNLKYGTKTVRGEKGKEKKEEDDGLQLSLTSYPVFELGNRVSAKYRFMDYNDLDAVSASPVNEGKLLHELFKTIEYEEDVDSAVQSVYQSGLIRAEERAGYRLLLHQYIQQPEAKEWFDRKYKVINERDILMSSGKKWRPDRVITTGDITLVIDYKFGHLIEDKYEKQVANYHRLLTQMGYKQVFCYIWYVKLNKVVLVNS